MVVVQVEAELAVVQFQQLLPEHCLLDLAAAAGVNLAGAEEAAERS